MHRIDYMDEAEVSLLPPCVTSCVLRTMTVPIRTWTECGLINCVQWYRADDDMN